MELRHFRYFIALAEHLSFTRAARAVHVTQSTLSHQIRQLEYELGYRLFDRSERSVTLTEAGQVLLPGVSRVLRDLDAVIRDAKSVVSVARGPVHILLGTQAFTAGVLPACLEFCAREHPEIMVTVEECASAETTSRMLSGDYDLGVGDEPPPGSGIVFEPLYREEMALTVSANHPFAGRRRVRLVELHGQQVVVPGRDVPARRILEACFESAGAKPHIVAEVNQPDRLYDLAVQSEIGVICTRNLRFSGDGLIKIPLEDPTPARTLGLLWGANPANERAARAFAGIIRDSLAPRTTRTPAWMDIDVCGQHEPGSRRAPSS